MPPLNDHNNSLGTLEEGGTEIISPIKPQMDRTGEGGSPRQWAWPAALILCLFAMVATGAWIIGYLHKNPMTYPQRNEKKAAAQPVDAAHSKSPHVNTAPSEVDSTEEKAETPAAAQPPGDTERQSISREVLSLMTKGRDHELQKAYAPARDAYRKAYDIDKDYEEARIALKRVSDQIAENEYRRTLTAGLKALEKKDYDDARKNLLKAKSLKPAAADAQAALAKLNRTVLLNLINSLRQKGQNAETAENWQAANNHYAAILALDPDNAFARQGVDRAQHRMRVLTGIQYFTDRPDTLFEESGLERALAVAEEARGLEPRGAELNRSLGRLEEMVAKAQRPVRVTITSDNLTRVDVYRIGRLGRFTEKTLDLKPGAYTVVGYREGYQDVRRQIVVRPGRENQRVTVICKVKV